MKSKTFFRTILIPMGILVVIEIILLFGTVFGGGVTKYLNQYASDILQERVINRKNYLENEMISKWSNIEYTADAINSKAVNLMDRSQIVPQELVQNKEKSNQFLMEISSELIHLIRNNRVTGAFVILSHGDLETEGQSGGKGRPGLYLRDLDPLANPSERDQDLLIERASVEVVRSLNISTDSCWKPQFEAIESYPFFYEPFQKAQQYDVQETQIGNFGYWCPPYTLEGDTVEVISYSIPLVLEDGTVYGVLGVELTASYLKKLIPYEEIAEKKQGAYILGMRQDDGEGVQNLLVNGPIYPKDGSRDEEFYSVKEELKLYNTNTPFSSQQWVLVGTVKNQSLFALADRVTFLLLMAILATLVSGAAGSFITSRLVSKPVVSLARDMERTDPSDAFMLNRTGIREIDFMAESIERLSWNVINSATKFSQILNMASVKLAGFEIDREEKSLFLTNNFFEVFDMNHINTSGTTYDEFQSIMSELEQYVESRDSDSVYFKIMTDDGERYVRLKQADDGIYCIGVAEDVTRAMQERNLMEYERDHDLLTGLLNRRAFYRELQELFSGPGEQLGIGAVVMMDLDNLKTLNDTYGHDTGDQYIKEAARCFVESAPEGTVVSRISGDEFYLFFYGYESRESLEKILSEFKQKMKRAKVQLPDESYFSISASGGVAWYPYDSTFYEELLRFSDFAMYKIKQSIKGELGDFDLGVYHKDAHLMQKKSELQRLIEQEMVSYHFQPIIDARTGEVFAYEALMRSEMNLLQTPADILAVAKQEAKLNQIEWLTWKKSLENYVHQMKEGYIAPDCRIFINSIASQSMSEERYQEIEERYGQYLEKIVLEVTEEEEMDEEILHIKTNKVAKWNAALALDDYGSGYNSEKNLLRLSPQYIKVDLAIIRDIDKNADKQKIMGNIVSYAHERGMFIVAEGIETPEEARKVIVMGADYLQGYFLAKPRQIPASVREEAKELITTIERETENTGN